MLLCAVSLVAGLLVLYGANSVRGTDQFWYLADVESVIDGSPPVTNVFFPGTLLRGDVGPDKPNYIYHNGPMIYIGAFLGEHIGAYRAWIAVNLLCHFLVALAIFLAARSLTSLPIAAAMSALYLVSPLAIWQTMSMLLEQYLAGIMALVAIGFFYRQSIIGKSLFLFGIALGALSHPMFVCIGLFTGVAIVFNGVRSKHYRVLTGGVALLLLVMYIGQSASVLFPTGFFPSLTIAIANVIPDRESMFWYFAEQGYPIDIHILMVKFAEAFVRQFISLIAFPFNIFTNLALVTWAWLFIFKRDKYAGILIPCGIVLTLYLALIVLMQHQVRYQQMIAPVVFILLAVGVHAVPVTVRKRFAVASAFFCALGLSFYLSTLSHQKADLQQTSLAIQSSELGFIGQEARVVAYDCDCNQGLNYILRPHPVLNMKSQHLTESAQSKVISLFDPDFFVSSRAQLNSDLSYLKIEKSVKDPLHGELFWYRVVRERKENELLITDMGFYR